jgi:Trk-type K+ transport system membrane component
MESMQNRLSFAKISPLKMMKAPSFAGRFAKEDTSAHVEWGSDALWDRLIVLIKGHNLWLFLCILVLSFTEDHLITWGPETCNVFYLLFELISAYANSGISMGVPGQFYSLSGIFTKVGTLVIIFSMLLGKHRGMPSIDFKFKTVSANTVSYD